MWASYKFIFLICTWKNHRLLEEEGKQVKINHPHLFIPCLLHFHAEGKMGTKLLNYSNSHLQSSCIRICLSQFGLLQQNIIDWVA